MPRNAEARERRGLQRAEELACHGRSTDVPDLEPQTRSRWLGTGLRWGGSLAAVGYVLSTLDREATLRALARLPPSRVVAGLVVIACAMAVGAARHRALLRAYGARETPPFGRTMRAYWAGHFYNTFLPGAVAGDVVRALALRDAFGPDGAVASFAVVLVERLLGLAALVLVAGLAFVVHPLPAVEGLAGTVALGVVLALVGVAAVASARRLATHVPGPVGRALGRLPMLASLRGFASAFGFSLASQLLVAALGHLLITGLVPSVPIATSCVVVPLGAAAAFFPLSVSGLGVREAAFARLFELAGVDAASAAAFALAFLGVQWLGALAGGLFAITLASGRGER